MSSYIVGLVVGLVFLVLLPVLMADSSKGASFVFRRVERWGSAFLGLVAVVLVLYSLVGILRFV